MSTRLSRRVVLLTALVFAVPTVGPTIAEAQADAPDAANLYPGRYAAVCIPAPMFGCVCTRDPQGEALMFTELDSTADHHLKDIGDTEYLRMIAWLRRTSPSRGFLGEPGLRRGPSHQPLFTGRQVRGSATTEKVS